MGKIGNRNHKKACVKHCLLSVIVPEIKHDPIIFLPKTIWIRNPLQYRSDSRRARKQFEKSLTEAMEGEAKEAEIVDVTPSDQELASALSSIEQ